MPDSQPVAAPCALNQVSSGVLEPVSYCIKTFCT